MADEKTPKTESTFPARLYRRRRNHRSRRQRTNLEQIKADSIGNTLPRQSAS